MKKATIKVRTVGQVFGCESTLNVNGKKIWTSRVFPYGFSANAYQAAEFEAENRELAISNNDELTE